MSDVLIPAPFSAERDDWGAKLLRDWASSELTPPSRVLVVGAGSGATIAHLAKLGATVTALDDQVGAVAATKKTLQRSGQQAEVQTSDAPITGAPFDVALINIVWWSDAERGAALITLAAAALRPQGLLVLAGGNDAGIKGAEAQLAALVGPTWTLAYKKGHRLVAALRPADWAPPPSPTPSLHAATIRGVTLQLEHSPGVFADGGLDPATALLIEALPLTPEARVLDLGAGAGVIAAALALLEPSLTLTLAESNVVAIAAAKRLLARHGLAAEVVASDSTQALGTRSFDLIVSNPPFHVGRMRTEAIAQRFIADALTVAAPGGELWLVANRFLRYEPVMEAAWGNVREMAGDSRFKVLRAQRRSP